MIITDIEDLRLLAKRKLPAIIYTYISNGGYEEETLRRNREDLQSITLLPRVLNDVSNRNLSVNLAGTPADLPIALAPVGGCGLASPNGEVEAAKAAKRFNVPFCLSTLSVATIEDVAKAIHTPFWFQLYLMREKKVGEALVERAKRAGVSTLVVSMDLHVRSQRHGEQKHGLIAPPSFSIGNIWDGLVHPSWLFSMIGSRRRTFGNLVGLVPHAHNLAKITEWLEEQFDPTLGVKDIEWARKVWHGKLLVKGILHPDDAVTAIKAGADGVIVSNHGGRQVDGAVSTASILPSVLERVNGSGAVLVDSGIRTGIDVLRMKALGADGCLIGRAYMYGLGAMGGKGVQKALQILRDELDQNMALCGYTDINKVDRALISSTVAPVLPFRNRAFVS